MYFYLVDKTGTGSPTDQIRPNVPNGVSYVCAVYYDQFLIGTAAPITGFTPLPPDEVTNITYNAHIDISNWSI